MTQEEISAEEVRNFRDYTANERAIFCLLSRLRRAQGAFRVLDLEQEDIDPKALSQPIMDLRDSDPRADMVQLQNALRKRKSLRQTMKSQGIAIPG